MATVLAHSEVRLWGQTVGAVAELDTGRIVFEYSDDFRLSGLEISPTHLPLSIPGPRSFEELRKLDAFQGLPGVLADALPDTFGNKVIRAYFGARGKSQKAFSPVQRLLYMGERAIGALTFHPAEDVPISPAELASLEMVQLVRDARKIVQGNPEITIPEIYRIGASAGGMRPKAVVLYNPTTGVIRSGYAPAEPGDEPSILKFDGAGDGTDKDNLDRPLPYNRVEAAYSRMGRDAGLDIVPITLLDIDGYAHLLIKRFDSKEGARLHQHTFGGLLHVDYNDPGASSYEEYLRVVLKLGMPQAFVDEAFRRMVFNVLAVNQDDHVKNLSFHMDQKGRWTITPAYDVTFAQGRGYTARHQMRLRDKTSDIRLADLLTIAEEFDVRKPERIIDRIASTLADWERYAKELDVPRDFMKKVGDRLEERAKSLRLA